MCVQLAVRECLGATGADHHLVRCRRLLVCLCLRLCHAWSSKLCTGRPACGGGQRKEAYVCVLGTKPLTNTNTTLRLTSVQSRVRVASTPSNSMTRTTTLHYSQIRSTYHRYSVRQPRFVRLTAEPCPSFRSQTAKRCLPYYKGKPGLIV